MSAQLRLSNLNSPFPSHPSNPRLSTLKPSLPLRLKPSQSFPTTTGGNSGNNSGGNSGHSGSSGGGGDENNKKPTRSDPIALFIHGWKARVSADPQFPFKVLMEEIVGVSACVLGDMSSRDNFGLNELDFVFSTLVVGSIVNFLLMYLLAPTSSLPSPSSLPTYMFAPGNFPLATRLTTLASKGATFAAVGFLAGIVGTAISNGLIAVRRRLDPGFETNNKQPPTVLNAVTWAAHMGLSSNLRYQTLNGVEFVMEKAMPGLGFRVLVVVMRCLNNVLGGMSFVMLARLTGSQKAGLVGEEEEGSGDNEQI